MESKNGSVPTRKGSLVAMGICLAAMLFPDVSIVAEEVDSETIERLIIQLGSDERKIRHQAELRLIEIGADALPFLGPKRWSKQPSVDFAVARLRRIIEQQVAQKSLQGTRVHFETTDQSLGVAAALGQLSEQTGYSIRQEFSKEIGQRRMSVKQDPRLFWNAFRDVCQAGHVQWGWQGTALVVSSEFPPSAGAETVVGCALIHAARASRRSTFNNFAARRTVRMRLQWDVEPAVKPFALIVADGDLQLETDTGMFGAFSPEAVRDVTFTGQSVEVPIDFVKEENQSPARGTLRGQARLRCGAGLEMLVFPLAAESGLSRTAGLTQVAMVGTETTNDTLSITLEVQLPADLEWESHRLGLLHRDVWLRSPEGETVRYSQMELTRQAGNRHTLRYVFPQRTSLDAGWSLEYRAPALFTTQRIEFVIRDIPL